MRRAAVSARFGHGGMGPRQTGLMSKLLKKVSHGVTQHASQKAHMRWKKTSHPSYFIAKPTGGLHKHEVPQ